MKRILLARFNEILEAESIIANVEFSKSGNMAWVNDKPPKIQVSDYLVEGVDYALAMFLHELAHLERSREIPEPSTGDKHDGKFADIFTFLVSEYMTDRSRHPTPANEEPLEPKMGGMVCPKCSTIVKYPDEYQKKEESLAVLAEKHNWPFVYYRKRVNPDDGPYTIELSDGYHIGREFHGPTYAAAEAKARAYLESLPDKGNL